MKKSLEGKKEETCLHVSEFIRNLKKIDLKH